MVNKSVAVATYAANWNCVSLARGAIATFRVCICKI